MAQDLIDIMDGFLKTSVAKQKLTDIKKFQSWKTCIALAKLGWKAEGCEKDGNNIKITWKKEGKKDICIVLTHVDQCLWIAYLKERK